MKHSPAGAFPRRLVRESTLTAVSKRDDWYGWHGRLGLMRMQESMPCMKGGGGGARATALEKQFRPLLAFSMSLRGTVMACTKPGNYAMDRPEEPQQRADW